MFDVSFSEIVIIGVVALIVVGPQRLPKVARTLGHLLGRMQRYVNDVKADISREIELDELRRLQSEMQDAARTLETTVQKHVSETEQALNQTVAPLAELPRDVEGALKDASMDAATPAEAAGAAAPAVSTPTDAAPPAPPSASTPPTHP